MGHSPFILDMQNNNVVKQNLKRADIINVSGEILDEKYNICRPLILLNVFVEDTHEMFQDVPINSGQTDQRKISVFY